MKLVRVLSILTLAFAVAGVSTSALAKKKKRKKRKRAAKSYSYAYGTAGCGLGSLVFANDPGFSQVFAATLNYTGVQTSGITSGTSNCTPQGGASAEQRMEQKVFVQVNLGNLQKDAARGSGETLAAFGELLGCADRARDELAQIGQQHHSDIFASPDAEKVLDQYVGHLKTRSPGQCRRV